MNKIEITNMLYLLSISIFIGAVYLRTEKDSHWIFFALVAINMIIVCMFLDHKNEKSKYIEIKRIDSTKYIQCIESQQYIISTNSSSNSPDLITVMLDSNAKPIKCSSTIYTKEQIALPINKNKEFIVKD